MGDATYYLKFLVKTEPPLTSVEQDILAAELHILLMIFMCVSLSLVQTVCCLLAQMSLLLTHR